MGLRMRDALLAATTLAAARGAVAGEVPGALLTLEVFAPDQHYLAYSRDVLRRTWDESPPPG